METYKKITEVLKSEKAQEIINSSIGAKAMDRFKAQKSLVSLVTEEVEKYYGQDFDMPNIHHRGIICKCYSFKPVEIAKFILREENIDLV